MSTWRQSSAGTVPHHHHPSPITPELATALLATLDPQAPPHSWASLAATLSQLQSSLPLKNFLTQIAKPQPSAQTHPTYTSSRKPTRRHNHSGRTHPPPLCKFWLKGKCNRYPCRFTHLTSSTWKRPKTPPNTAAQHTTHTSVPTPRAFPSRAPSPQSETAHAPSSPLPDLNIPSTDHLVAPSQPSPPSPPRSRHSSHKNTPSPTKPANRDHPSSGANSERVFVFSRTRFPNLADAERNFINPTGTDTTIPNLADAEQSSLNPTSVATSLLDRFVNSFRPANNLKRKARSRSSTQPHHHPTHQGGSDQCL